MGEKTSSTLLMWKPASEDLASEIVNTRSDIVNAHSEILNADSD